MVSARRQMGGGVGVSGAGAGETKAKAVEKGAGGEPGRRPLSNYNYDEAVLKVQEWNEALKCGYPSQLSPCILLT